MGNSVASLLLEADQTFTLSGLVLIWTGNLPAWFSLPVHSHLTNSTHLRGTRKCGFKILDIADVVYSHKHYSLNLFYFL